MGARWTRAAVAEGLAARRPSLRIGHLTTVDLSLAKLLRKEMEVVLAAGHKVFGISAPGPYRAELERLGVEVVSVPALSRPWAPGRDLRAAAQIWRILDGLGLDVLHTHTPKAGVIGRVVGKARGIPAVVNTCHGLWATPEDPWPKRALVLGAEAVAAQFSDAELFQNPEDQAAMRWALRRNRSEVVGNGTDLEKFRFDPSERKRVRHEWDISDETIVVGCVARVVREKGVREFQHAAAMLRSRAEFVWVGPEDRDRERIAIRREGPVRFLGERQDMPAVYSALDVFVLPSYREGFPRSAMEAAACGRPIVLTDIRGSREIGSAGVEALFVPPGDGASLSAAIEQLLANPSERERLAEAARRRALAEFDQGRVAERSLATYFQVLTGRKGQLDREAR